METLKLTYNHLLDINSYLKFLRVRQELIENNYAVHYLKHMKLLKELFIENNLQVAKTEDEALDLI